MSHPVERIRVIAVVAVMIALVPLLLLRRIEARISRAVLETDDSMYVLPDADWIVPLSLGYREAAAGLIWARFLTYFGEQVEVHGTHAHTEQYIDAVTTLDPYFYRAYTFGSTAAIYTTNIIDREAVEQAIRAIERGLEVFPEDGNLHYHLGFLYFFELPAVVEESEAEEARRRGIDEICMAAILGGGPPYLPLVCSRLASQSGMEDVAIDHLLESLVEARDETTRARIEARLEATMSPERAYSALRRVAEYRTRWMTEMPYVPGGFYAIAGPRPPVPVTDEVELPFAVDQLIDAEWEALAAAEVATPEEEAGEGDSATDEDGGDEAAPAHSP